MSWDSLKWDSSRVGAAETTTPPSQLSQSGGLSVSKFLTTVKNWGSFWLSVLKSLGHTVKFKGQVWIFLKSPAKFWVHTNTPIKHAYLCRKECTADSPFKKKNQLSSLPNWIFPSSTEWMPNHYTGMLCHKTSGACWRSPLKKKKKKKKMCTTLTHWDKSFASDFENCA